MSKFTPVFILITLVLIGGRMFLDWKIDVVVIALLAILWLPFVVPRLRKIRYKDLELDLFERVRDLQEEVAEIGNEIEVGKEEMDHSLSAISGKEIRLNYDVVDSKKEKVTIRTRIDAPEQFLDQITSVDFLFPNDSQTKTLTSTSRPFATTFQVDEDFTLKADIGLQSGLTLRRQRFIKLPGQ